MTVHDFIYWIYKYVYLSRVNTGISKISREAVITQPKNQTSKKKSLLQCYVLELIEQIVN